MGTIPVWLKDLIDKANGNSKLVEAGIGNLLNNFPLVMRACRFLSHSSFLYDLTSLVERHEASIREKQIKPQSVEQPPSGNATEVLLKRIAADPHAFWSEFYAQKFGNLSITVPALPHISAKTQAWIDDGSLLPIFLPAEVTQVVYLEGWIRSDLDYHNDNDQIRQYPLPGRWVVVELVNKSDWNNGSGYCNGRDRLALELGLQTRFDICWDYLCATLCPQTVKLWGIKKKVVRPLTAEEWNFFGNILLELNRLHGTRFQDLGATASWEWCENTYGSGYRVIVGDRDYGGLAGVRRNWSYNPYYYVGFRLLGVL